MSILDKPRPMPFGSGLMPTLHSPPSPYMDSNDQPEQAMEAVLKKKREKIAFDKLGIQPELDSAV